MPKTRSVAQQRKRRVRLPKAAPFPVPIETVTGESANDGHWFYYRGTLADKSVVVEHTGDMDFLYRMGFFGKGEMSRGQPDWSERSRVVSLPAADWQQSAGLGAVVHARVTSRRRYMSRVKWRLLADGDHDILEQLHDEEQFIAEQVKVHTEDLISDINQGETEKANETCTMTCPDVDPDLEAESSENVTVDSLGMHVKLRTTVPSNWDEEDGDVDFWGTDVPVPADNSAQVSSTSWDASDPGDADFWGTEAADTVKDVHAEKVTDTGKDPQCLKPSGAENVSDDVLPVNCTQEDNHVNVHVSGVATNQPKCVENLSVRRKQGSSEDSDLRGVVSHTVFTAGGSDRKTACSHDDDPDQSSKLTQDSFSSDSKRAENSVLTTAIPDSRIDSAVECDGTDDTEQKEIIVDEIATDGNEDVSKETVEDGSSVVCSRFCEGSDQVSGGGAMFVIADSDEEEVDKEGRVYRLEKRWKPVLKQDPFPLKENLHLSLEEAYFLSFGLGCLEVLDTHKNPLDLTSMWTEFCKRQSSFVPNYIAYHYFRSKNWVPKPGLKFGCNFLLYRDGPPFFHGSYSVVVKFLDSSGQPVEGYEDQRKFSWTSLAGLKRITEHVGKELLFCYVIKPKEMTAEEMMSPKCISAFQVKEVVVSRWVSSQEREGKGLEEIP